MRLLYAIAAGLTLVKVGNAQAINFDKAIAIESVDLDDNILSADGLTKEERAAAAAERKAKRMAERKERQRLARERRLRRKAEWEKKRKTPQHNNSKRRTGKQECRALKCSESDGEIKWLSDDQLECTCDCLEGFEEQEDGQCLEHCEVQDSFRNRAGECVCDEGYVARDVADGLKCGEECDSSQVWSAEEFACKSKLPACPEGAIRLDDDSDCLCKARGFVLDNGKCQLPCPEGAIRAGSDECFCPAKGHELRNGKCQLPLPACPEGAFRPDDDSDCLCKAKGFVLDNGKCQLPCPEGSVRAGSDECFCIAKALVLRNGKCQLPLPACPEGAVRLDDDVCTCVARGHVLRDGKCQLPLPVVPEKVLKQKGAVCNSNDDCVSKKCIPVGGWRNNWATGGKRCSEPKCALAKHDGNCGQCDGASFWYEGWGCTHKSTWRGTKKGAVIHRMDMRESFTLAFHMKIGKVGNKKAWRNILHLGDINDHRQPGIWYTAGTNYDLHVVTRSNSKNQQACKIKTFGWKAGTVVHMKIQVTKKDRKMRVWINGKHRSTCGATITSGKRRKIWMSDPWSDRADVWIKDLSYWA